MEKFKSKKLQTTDYKLQTSLGFTLIELMVSVTVFSIVMTIAAGSLFSIMEGNRKAHAIQSVMNNLNFAIESMSRSIRMGSNYTSTSLSSFSFVSSDNSTAVTYFLPSGTEQIMKTKCSYSSGSISGCSTSAITASEVHITYLGFYVTGTSGDSMQPKVIMVIDGYSGESIQARSDFNIETAVSQRQPK